MKFFRATLFALTLLLFFVISQWPSENVKVVFCDVGQGDGAIVIKGTFQALIDTGPKNGGVVECLSSHLPFWDREIEVLINSHPEVDHLGDLAAVVEHYKVGTILLDGKLPNEKLAQTIRKMVSGGTKLVVAAAGDRLRYGDLYFDIFWPETKYADLIAWLADERSMVLGKETGVNRYSLVVLMSFGGSRVLFTGDIGEGEEVELVSSGRLGNVDVLKAAHHGSKFSSSEAFVEAVRPKLTVFSVGKNNYGHPTGEAIERVMGVGSRIWRTDKQGELELISDGKKIRVL